jgi:hypothetical protein
VVECLLSKHELKPQHYKKKNKIIIIIGEDVGWVSQNMILSNVLSFSSYHISSDNGCMSEFLSTKAHSCHLFMPLGIHSYHTSQ